MSKIMSSTNRPKAVILNLSIGDQLTTISCGHIVVELIKFIVYQRLQIPYTYQWLKEVVNKKKMSEGEDLRESFQSQRHFRSASSAVENLDFILKSLLLEINGSLMPDEVCIALGSTPVTCKEVYRLLLPLACHKPQCHSSGIATGQKIQSDVFRSLATSDKLSQIFSNTMNPTNMYVFIKKRITNTEDVLSTDNFQMTTGYRIPRSARIVIIDFRPENNENVTCCSDFKIFGDSPAYDRPKLELENIYEQFCEIESSDGAKWYQSTYLMKGFKDCAVNGVSVINSWLNS